MNRWLLERLAVVTEEEKNILAGRGLDRTIYTDRQEFIIDFMKMKKQEQVVVVRPHTRFVDFPDHKHNYVEMMYQCKGSTRHVINRETELVLQEGELLLLNQHVSHAIRKCGEEDLAVNILALPAFFDFALQMAGEDEALTSFLLSTLHRDMEEPIFIHYKVSEVLPVNNLIENMIWSLLFENQPDEQISKLTMATLLMTIGRNADHLIRSDSDPKHAVVAEALKEIEDNYSNPNLGRIADKYHVSLAYVSAMVKESTGQTFTDKLQEKRLKMATDLLQNSLLSVADISFMVGYNNTSYFYTLFKKHYDMTPHAFRKAAKQG